jgi:hypothetical protein
MGAALSQGVCKDVFCAFLERTGGRFELGVGVKPVLSSSKHLLD